MACARGVSPAGKRQLPFRSPRPGCLAIVSVRGLIRWATFEPTVLTEVRPMTMPRRQVQADDRHLAEFEVDGERLTIDNCVPFAQVANDAAGIMDVVLRAPSGRFVRVTTVADIGEGEDPLHRGWYVAHVVDEIAANLLRESWAVQTEQPDPDAAHPLI